jgi:amylosucrase
MLTHLPEAPEHTAWLNYVRAHDDIGWGLSDADAARVGQDGHDTRVFCADHYAGRRPGSPAEGYDFQRDPVTGEARTSGTTAALTGLQKALAEADPDAIDRAVRRILMLHGIVYAMRGFPQLYSGDELGLLNDFSYLTTPTRARDNRWMHRPTMDWEKAALRHDPDRVEHLLFEGLKRLAKTRRDCPALHGAASETVLRTVNDRLFLVERGSGNDRLLLVANVAGTAQALSFDALPPRWRRAAYVDALTHETHRFASPALLLPPYRVRWFQPVASATPGVLLRTPVQVEVHTEWGEEVYLVGNLEALGSGDPEQAAGPLSAHAYPLWTLALDVPEGTWFTFRWLVRREGRTVRRSPHRFAMRAGADAPWALDEN